MQRDTATTIKKPVSIPVQPDPRAGQETTSDYDREKLQERLAKLAGGVAVIRVGGSTEVEVKERKDRVDDALHATRAAVEEGIVPGGGVALARASLILAKLQGDNDDQRFGIEIVRKAVQTPLRQIAENAGEDGAVIAGKTLDRDEHAFGFDAQTRRVQGSRPGGHHRPDQGRAHGAAERGVRRRPAGDDRGDGRGAAGEEGGRHATRAAAWAAWATWISDREHDPPQHGEALGRKRSSASFFC